jgi:hypothetical protein
MRKLFKYTLCKLGIHNWEIFALTVKSKFSSKFQIDTFGRECLWCNKEQHLEKPKKYHPSKYIWVTQVDKSS